MLCKMSMNIYRSNTYMIIGICLGLSLSFLFSPEDIIHQYHQQQIDNQYQQNVQSEKSTLYATGSISNSPDEYIPHLNVEEKPRRAQKFPKTIVRPRYYSTELGIRDKLFVGILTSKERLYSYGVAYNKTVSHLVDKVRYFITIPEGGKPNVSLPGIVGFTDTRIILKPFHVIKYITDNYLEEYDYYFITKDINYINARGLVDLVNKISISRDVHMGNLIDNSNEFCSLDGGILLSNEIVKKMKTSLDWCVKNTFSTYDDINFGRCIYHATKIPCSSSIDSTTFRSIHISTNDNYIDHLRDIKSSNDFISLYPIDNYNNIYKIHAHFALKKIQMSDKHIDMINNEILISTNDSTWPIGNQQENKAPGRFDILQWNYFNTSHIFMSSDLQNVRYLIGSLKIEIEQAIETAKYKIHDKYNNKYEFVKLENGWRKSDASRGLDYILDIIFFDKIKSKNILKRIHVCKLLGKAEILSIPYVTENTRINIILPIKINKIEESLMFIDNYSNVCMKNKDKTSLMLVLLYNFDSPSKGATDIFYKIKQMALSLTEKYKRNQSKITWLSIRLPTNSTLLEADTVPQVIIGDLITKKYSPESLILFIETNVLLEPEYLNRVRMNTISQWQIFSPIPFVEFQPNITYFNKKNNDKIDVNRKDGRYDHLNYESISFYVKDYQNIRKLSQYDIPIINNDKDIVKNYKFLQQNHESIFNLFILYSKLHPFRAVEPALKILYSHLNCQYLNIKKNSTCNERKLQQLGQRRQLANLILDYQKI
ncbi:hypothetical protein HCN44_006151 [Aphidius gifuensis]|uniref:Hexosyltransferase n=1 Tax=Aphidius gifuensis TaxID=684658 RepID=A0A835CYF2_APHGI|nr:chondroitin sulfate glucuronyltransferase [Aphidius gifuensis]KAF7997580.1 hypothetical protein HCN44_006151 [Aphidius gifuensis]